MTAVSGTFTATGQSASFAPPVATRDTNGGAFNVTLSGTFVGTVKLQRSFDNGTTWHDLTAVGTAIAAFTTAVSEVWIEPEPGVIFRLNCTAYTSGTVTYRLGS